MVGGVALGWSFTGTLGWSFTGTLGWYFTGTTSSQTVLCESDARVEFSRFFDKIDSLPALSVISHTRTFPASLFTSSVECEGFTWLLLISVEDSTISPQLDFKLWCLVFILYLRYLSSWFLLCDAYLANVLKLHPQSTQQNTLQDDTIRLFELWLFSPLVSWVSSRLRWCARLKSPRDSFRIGKQSLMRMTWFSVCSRMSLRWAGIGVLWYFRWHTLHLLSYTIPI